MKRFLKMRNKLVAFVIAMCFVVPSIVVGQDILQPGEKVPSFSIPDHEGRMYGLSKSAGKSGVVVMFVSTQCPVSNAYNSRIIMLAELARQNNLDFIAINSNATESLEDVRRYAVEKGLTFPVLKDEGNVVADLFGATVTPEVFLIDKSQTVRYHGGIDNDQREAKVTERYLESAIKAYAGGGQIQPDDVRPKGCIIKRMR
ncbi:MAG: thioredoxin family protein [Chlorobiales bacterium]|nr:thioredoxin family protein [Chlorobiales bacterium]